jgi:acetyl-CoA carboxylase biotin carboxyl carrier protein
MAVAAGAVMPAVGAAVPGTVISAAGAVVPAAQEEIGSDNVVSSPLVGIFYSASSPDAEDFVKVGDRVKKGQVLGIIEAMKLMNEIESEYDGVVEAILVRNEDVVEYGQPLFRIR